MRFLLVLTATLFSAVSPIQTNRQDPPDLIVVKFSCGQSDSGGHMIRSVQEPDPSDRQFFCVVKAKPSEAKTFELYSPLAPSRVVDAAKANSKSTIDDKGKVMINQVEYADGSMWKRPQWNPKTFATDDREK